MAMRYDKLDESKDPGLFSLPYYLHLKFEEIGRFVCKVKKAKLTLSGF